MALTHELRDTRSPVRQFIRNSAPDLVFAGSRGHLGTDIARQFGFEKLMARELIIPVPAQVKDKRSHSAPIGTAFDFRVRMMLGDFEPKETLALSGLQAFQNNTSGIRNGKKMAQVLSEAFGRTEEMIAAGNDIDRDRVAIVLGWCESIYRAGVYRVMDGSVGRLLRKVSKVDGDLFDALDPLQLADLEALRSGAVSQVEAWRIELAVGARFDPNPNFQGSKWVGGADADWMIADTLIDCKTTERLTNSWIRDTLFQLLGYTLLDFEDKLGIRKLGIWLPRREAFQTWSLDQVLARPAESALPQIREEFQAALITWHEQMAEERRLRWEALRKLQEELAIARKIEEAAAATKAEEKRAERREYDRNRRAAKKAAVKTPD